MIHDPGVETGWLVELLEAQAEALRAAFLVVGPDGTLFSYNERFLSQWGVPDHVLAQRPLSDLTDWLIATGDEPAEALANLLMSEDPPKTGEIHLTNGDVFAFHIVDFSGGRVWAFHNVHEIHHLIVGLRDAGNLLRILEGHIDGIVLELDTERRVVGLWANDRTYFEGSDIGLQGRRLVDLVGPAQGVPFENVIRDVFLTEQPGSFEYTLDIHGEHRVFAADARLMPSSEDEAPRVTVLVRDITERTRMQRQFLETERLASVGLLAAGVAHEVNNPLAYTLLNLERIQTRLRELARRDASAAEQGEARGTRAERSEHITWERGLVDELRDAVAMSLEGARRVQTIVQDLRRFSRSDRNDPLVPIDVHETIEFAIDMARHETRDRARMVREFGEVPLVLASETRLTQIFLNLIVNAAQAIPAGAPEDNEIRVVTRRDALDRAVIEVRDTGEGMSSGVMQHIFEPFFTTKPAGVGTGLGLAICQGIATSLGGELAVESELGRGSIFRLLLPAAESGDAPSPPSSDTSEPSGEPPR